MTIRIESGTIITSPTPTCHTIKPMWKYRDPSSDESILNEVNPCLVSLKEMSIVTAQEKEIYPARRTFVLNTLRFEALTLAFEIRCIASKLTDSGFHLLSLVMSNL